jgi:acetyl esterase/lipase
VSSRLILRYLALIWSATLAHAAELQRDITYGNVDETPLLLDASIPAGEGPFPIVILVHGGGWGSGDKSGADRPNSGADITPWFAPLDDHFAWFSINYRLAPAHRWPACYDDTLAAIDWVRAHAADFKGDPTRIALLGHSAGGQLVCLAATAGHTRSRVQAVVGCAAVTDFEQDLERRGGLGLAQRDLLDRPQEVTPEALAVLREIAPLNHVGPGLPAFLLVHGDADKTVTIVQSTHFQSRLRAAGNGCDLITLPGAPHRLTRWAEHDPAWMTKIVAWLEQTLR